MTNIVGVQNRFKDKLVNKKVKRFFVSFFFFFFFFFVALMVFNFGEFSTCNYGASSKLALHLYKRQGFSKRKFLLSAFASAERL